jgi:hypothetical protein
MRALGVTLVTNNTANFESVKSRESRLIPHHRRR